MMMMTMMTDDLTQVAVLFFIDIDDRPRRFWCTL